MNAGKVKKIVDNTMFRKTMFSIRLYEAIGLIEEISKNYI